MTNNNQMENGSDVSITWGLLRNVTPRFGARLVQERYRLHFLSDRSEFVGEWSEKDISALQAAFPLIIKELEGALLTGELDSSRQKCLRVKQGGFICEADSLGSFGYIYLCIYQEEM